MYFTESPEGAIVSVRAAPRSSKAGIEGLWGDDAIKIKIKSAPVDGKANKELVEVLADEFDLPKSSVIFKSGETSKTKRLLLKGVSVETVKNIVENKGT